MDLLVLQDAMAYQAPSGYQDASNKQSCYELTLDSGPLPALSGLHADLGSNVTSIIPLHTWYD
jgi:hypothetical protein